MQRRQRNLQKSVITCRVVVLPIQTYSFSGRSRCRRRRRRRCLCFPLTNIRRIQVSFIQSQSVKETPKYFHYLSHAQSSLVHVAEVKHGLCVVLLFRCKSVVICSCLVINLGSVTIIMIITHFHSSCCVTCGKNKQKIDTKEHLNLCNYCTCLRSLEKVSQAMD